MSLNKSKIHDKLQDIRKTLQAFSGMDSVHYQVMLSAQLIKLTDIIDDIIDGNEEEKKLLKDIPFNELVVGQKVRDINGGVIGVITKLAEPCMENGQFLDGVIVIKWGDENSVWEHYHGYCNQIEWV